MISDKTSFNLSNNRLNEAAFVISKLKLKMRHEQARLGWSKNIGTSLLMIGVNVKICTGQIFQVKARYKS